ncbi:hypothetical protein QEH59_11925 [Coraliomargarita sp. SDUM461004]|uniref:STAS/SEC14 domain-containing protein n=1 Tax=Thalassobacterium sedimentorum TaxID=3041258 RepID=A0ABU1AJY9_9BACT|nr:hypothetical protein [Coraliomargarita sp. SDUM461004]MDQ8195137.1 hypothetical protein [Coraliomargarita sp. SDUM461004]
MPYETKWQTHGIIWTYSGTLTGEELLRSNFEIFGDERFDDIRYQVVDLTAVTEVKVTEKHMRKIAHLDMAAARSNPRVKVAVVTTAKDGQFLSETYDRYTRGKSPWMTQLFTTLEEAATWLNTENES